MEHFNASMQYVDITAGSIYSMGLTENCFLMVNCEMICY